MSQNTSTVQTKSLSREEINEICEKAEKGDKSVLPQVRELLSRPEAVEFVGGNLAKASQEAVLAKFVGKDLFTREAITITMASLREALAGPTPNPLEGLLIDRILSCWLHLHLLEKTYVTQHEMPLTLGDYYQKSIDRAQRRYLAAIKTLANVRRLALPALIGQLNIAEQQVNVSESA